MPERPRRSRPLPRHSDVFTETDGLFGRLADLVIENPARAGGIVAMVLVSGAIFTNAAYFQTAHHPDPFFATRGVEAPASPTAAVASAPAADAAAQPAPDAPSPSAAPLQPQEQVLQPAGEVQAMPALPKAKPMPEAAARPAAAPAGHARAGSPPAAQADTVTGTLVADTQRALADLHLYEGPIDGLLGPGTRSAISSFEMRIGLIPTGQPSRQLLAQIRRGVSGVAAPDRTGSVPAADIQLKRIQHALNEIGYGPIPEDGRNGDKTAAAIRRFEQDNRLTPTGRPSDALAAKLVLIGAMPAN